MKFSDYDDGRLAAGLVVKGRYKIGEFVGRGGSGVIYAARDLKSGQKVALKVLSVDLLSHPGAVARYYREARAAAGIGHPNVCGVLDAGQLWDGRPFLIMELLIGTTLSVRIRDEGAMPFSIIVSVLSQTLSGLQAAHAKKIVHRDIKPDNVFLSERIPGAITVKLLDFGIAKSLDENAELSLTRTGMVVGTPFYMAPEQARGLELDHRVDLYGCGVLLYEMLTGKRPFLSTNYNALMLQVLTADPPDPRLLRPAVPAGFVGIILKAMAKDRNERFADAAEFQRAIQAVQQQIDDGPGPEKTARIAHASREPTSRPPHESAPSTDIPIYIDSVVPPMIDESSDSAIIQEDSIETTPFAFSGALAPAAGLSDFALLLPPKTPADPSKSRPRPPIDRGKGTDDEIEIMVDSCWMAEDRSDDIDEESSTFLLKPPRTTSNIPDLAWNTDDEPTRVEPTQYKPERDTRPERAPQAHPPPNPLPKRSPGCLPRPKRKG